MVRIIVKQAKKKKGQTTPFLSLTDTVTLKILTGASGVKGGTAGHLPPPVLLIWQLLSPAVVKSGARRRQSQPLAELIPLPGHLAQLEEDGVQAVAGRPVVVDGRRRGGRLAVDGRTCNSREKRAVNTRRTMGFIDVLEEHALLLC